MAGTWSNEVAGVQVGYEIQNWRGGENYFDGPHDTFCFVCGSPENLIGCQTCDNCYHVGCMEPTVEGVPRFWFCPHCAAKDWDKPPPPCPDKLPGMEKGRNEMEDSRRLDDEVARELEVREFDSNSTPDQTPQQSSQPPTQRAVEKTYPTPPTNAIPNPSPPKQIQKRKTESTPHPPHKKRKSKYSPFTPSIEKALGVITGELESVSRYVRTIEELRERVRDLEQEVKLRDGRLALLEGGREVG